MRGRRLRINGLKAIAKHLGLHSNTVSQYARITVPEEHRLPVFTLSASGAKNATLYAWQDELDAWLERKSQLFFQHGRKR